jgi:hypothetical protein
LLDDTICLRAPSISFDGGSATAVTSAANLIESGTVTFSNSPSIYTIYTGPSTQEQFTGIAMIHIESVSFPCDIVYEVKVSGADPGNAALKRFVLFNPAQARGFAISVPSGGNYRLDFSSQSAVRRSSGFLPTDSVSTFAATENRDTFYTQATVNADGSDCQLYATKEFTSSRDPWHQMTRHWVRAARFTVIVLAF